jgi:amino acid transporter
MSQQSQSYGLKAEALSPLETIAQSVANIAPTGTPTLVIPLVFALAGSATWLAYLVAMIGILFVAAAVTVFARRSASPGALYTYAATGLGAGWGVVTGWALFVAYVGTGAAVTTGFSNYANVLLARIVPGAHLHSVFLITLSVVLAWWVAHKDIKLSTQLALVLELGSVALVTLLAVGTVLTNGIDWGQLKLEGSSIGALRNGLVLATFSYVGFESATVLGAEAKNPLRTIPRAVVLSATLIGALFILSSYAEVLAFHGQAVTLDKSSAPLQVVADRAGLSFLGLLIDIGAVVSFFACVLASVNAAARVLFFLAHHRVFPSIVASAHERNKTPYIAVAISAALTWAPAGLLSLRGVGDFDIYGWVGTVATIAFILTYVAVLIAAPAYLRRIGELRWRHVACAVLGSAFLVNAVVGNLYPVPAAPYNWLPYLTFAILAGGGVWYRLRRTRIPGLGRDIGRSVEALELGPQPDAVG